MANPLFNQLGGNQPNDGGFGNLLAQIEQFRAQFQGDPRAEVQRLLQSGKISQAQLDQAQQMANQMMRLIPHR